MTDGELVSVVITTHNRVKLLKRAINSVLNQTYKNIEIIIADDASTDNTEEIIQEYKLKYDNIIYIKHKKTMGANVGRNNAIKASNGEFIAGLDDDDEFTPDRIEILVNNYEDKYSFITTKNIIELSSSRKKYQKGKELISIQDILYENYVGNQGLIKKQRLYDVGLYDENLTACQDYDMWVRLILKFGPAKSLNKYTQIIYANHSHNRISNPNSKKKFRGYFKFYKKFKSIMNKNQRKSQLLIIYKHMNYDISLKLFLILFTKKNFINLFRCVIKQKLNAIQGQS